MARASVDKAYRSFINGLVTEATGLTYPENSARDIDNCDIELDGQVRRRLGLGPEDDAIHLFQGSPVFASSAYGIHYWPRPGGEEDLNFVVFQVGSKLLIRNWDAEHVSDLTEITPHIAAAADYNMDLSTELTGSMSNTTVLQSSPGGGRLWFANPFGAPFYLEYDAATLSVSVTELAPAVRDFNGVDDGLAVDEEPTVLTAEHLYNLLNQGWLPGHIATYFSTTGRYPSNAQQWILGKNSTDDFDATLLTKQYFGNSPAPRGHFPISAITGEKSGATFTPSPLGGITSPLTLADSHDEPAVNKWTTVAFYAGRVWYAGDKTPKRPNGVYFSKIISKPEDANVWHQENDPTSEHFSEVLATDGGVVYLTEASNIRKLVPFSSGILALAENGVWFISGGADGSAFTATNFSANKISSVGTTSPDSVAVTDSAIFFFGENSIYAAAVGDDGVSVGVQDVAEKKILSFYNSIDRRRREQVHGVFDAVAKKIVWSYLESDEGNYAQLQRMYNRMLILDTRTGAYTKYSFYQNELLEGLPTTSQFMNGPAMTRRQRENEDMANITIKPMVINLVPVGFSNDYVDICEFNRPDFHDGVNTAAIDYSSYIVTGDETLGDLQRSKQATYLHSFFRRTEDGFVDAGGGNLIPTNPSGCLVTARWDWHNTSAGGRWSDPQVAYRYRRPYLPSGTSDPFDNGEEIVYTKLKIRGKGRALALRYESVEGKDFRLLGFSLPFTAEGV